MGPLCERKTSSTKPEVHNKSQRLQRTTKPRPQATFVTKLSEVLPCSFRDMGTDRQTDKQRRSSQYSHLCRRRSNKDDIFFELSNSNTETLRPRKGCQVFIATVSVCLSVCLSARMYQKPHGRTLPIFVHADYGCDSVILWRRCDTLCTSGFVDDVMYSHNGPRIASRGEITAY